MSDTQAPRGLYAQFQTNPDIERDGIELEYFLGEGQAPVIIKIARAGGGNTRYNKVLERRAKPYRRQIQTETIEPATMENLMREVYADAVVLGWQNMTGADGTVMEFNRDNVVQVMKDLPDLFADIQASANKVALFRKAELDVTVKN